MAKRRRAESPSPSPSTDDSSSSGNRVAKRPKVRNLRGRRGSLQDLPQMPLDVLYMVCFTFEPSYTLFTLYSFQILSLLDPLDLLHLARTSKDFRNLLMSRSSISLWKVARLNIEGLPDCPPYLSEPAYANLAFDAHCHVRIFLFNHDLPGLTYLSLKKCLKNGVYEVIWEFRARYCKSCKETRYDCVEYSNG